MDPLFAVHSLNTTGQLKAIRIAETFNTTIDSLTEYIGIGVGGREMAIVRTKLEEACFYAKKAMANQKENQQ